MMGAGTTMVSRLHRSAGLLLFLVVLPVAGCGEFHPHFPRADAGSEGETAPGERFTLVALPDTQHIVLAYPEMFYAQAYWIRDKAAVLNLKYVMHEGDITNDSTEEEWRAAGSRRSITWRPNRPVV